MRTLCIAAVATLSLSAGSASAQFGTFPVPNWGPGYRGNISPYLNITRFNNGLGGNAGVNYFLGTRSEQQRRANAQEFRADLEAIPNRDRLAPEDIPQGGKTVPSGSFSLVNNTGSYFNNTGDFFASPGRPGSGQSGSLGPQRSPQRRAGDAPRSGLSPGFSRGIPKGR